MHLAANENGRGQIVFLEALVIHRSPSPFVLGALFVGSKSDVWIGKRHFPRHIGLEIWVSDHLGKSTSVDIFVPFTRKIAHLVLVTRAVEA